VSNATAGPNTSPTMLLTDAVGTVAGTERLPQLTAAFESGTIGEGEPAAGVEAVPVRHGDAVVAVLTHQTAVAARRKSSPLEAAYLDCANDLQRMLAEGTFPNVGDLPVSRSSPRVGDGFIRLDVNGNVVFASPNAISAYHRMGLTSELEGHHLVIATRPLISDPFEAHELAEHIRDSLTGGSSMRLEVDAGGAAVLMRTLPLVVHGDSVGAAVLIRDVTEIKRRDRALLSKDATIREIHHRVKNNLQTVAALLRLQARRLRAPEARAALDEAVRRVGSIAVVHETLAQASAGVAQRAEKFCLAGDTLRGGIRGAMEGDDVAAGVYQRGRGLLDLRQQRVEGNAMRPGHAQPRHVCRHARRHVAHHFLFHHAVRGRDDQSDARRHANLGVCQICSDFEF